MTVEAYEYEEEAAVDESKDEKDEVNDSKEEVSSKDDQTHDVDENDDPDPGESKARDEGWVPRDEWKGKSADWVDFREFNIRGELMSRIKSQSGQLHALAKKTSNLEEALQVLGEHNKKIADQEYKRAIKDMRAQLREAKGEEDFDTVDELEEQIETLKESQKDLQKEEKEAEETKTSKKEVSKELPPAQKKIVEDWYNDPNNKWYEEDPFLQPIADRLFVTRLEQNGGDFSDAFSYMETKIKNRFPDEFGETSKRKGSVTESNGRASGKKKAGSKSKFTKSDLSEEQLKVAKTFVDQGIYDNIQDYVNELVSLGEVE